MTLKDFLKPNKKKIGIMVILVVLTIVSHVMLVLFWSVPVLDIILVVLDGLILTLPFTLMFMTHVFLSDSNILIPEVLKNGYVIMLVFAVSQLIYWYLLACLIAHFSAGRGKKKKGKKR